MKKHKLVLSLLLAALLVCMPLMLASCGAPKNTEITWSVIQEGGTADTVTTTAVKITFSGAVENLAAADVTVSGAAVKSGAAFTKSADSKVWTVPVTVTAAGGATVTVNKAGVKSASKTVAVHFKEEVAAPGAITWEAAQSGGIEGTRSTGAIQLTFSSPVEDLTAQEVSVGGVATLKANAAPGADSADKTVWLIPVTVSAAGNATVAINKTGVHATTKTVAVIYKAPAVVGDGEYANANGFPEGYTGTPFTDPNFPTTVKWPLPDQADGQKIPGKVMLTYFDNGGQ
ncbi:MAG: hypothetical protein FWD58_00395, partial [Firmicutes bacterium]|nr:hypothetical protein [Bacillota bacterium]